jgi:hypothetical protein
MKMIVYLYKCLVTAVYLLIYKLPNLRERGARKNNVTDVDERRTFRSFYRQAQSAFRETFPSSSQALKTRPLFLALSEGAF